MNGQCGIYRLSDRTGVRYVGKSTRGYLVRFQGYASESKKPVKRGHPGRKTPASDTDSRRQWMDEHLHEIIPELIETVPTNKGAEREKFWISRYLAQGCALVNDHSTGQKKRTKRQ